MQVVVAGPDKPIWEGIAEKVSLPLEGGRVVVFDHHAPMVGVLVPGDLILESSGKQEVIPVRRGVVRVRDNRLDVLVR